MDRPFFDTSLGELQALLLKHRGDPAVLGQLWVELSYRKTGGARQLQREVRRLLDGQIPHPPPRRPASADDQADLF